MKRILRHIGIALHLVLLTGPLFFQSAVVIAQEARPEVRCTPPEEQDPEVYMTEQQRACFDSGIINYDLQDTVVPEDNSDDGSPSSGPLTGCAGAQQTYNFLKEQGGGLSDADIAGIIGNLDAESGFNPRAINSAGYTGIAQWGNPGRWNTLQTWVSQNPGHNGSTDPFDMGNQLRFLWHEASGMGVIQAMAQQSGQYQGREEYEYSAWYWGRFFEIAIIGGSTSETPFTNVQHLDRRIGRSLTALNNISSGNWGC